MNKTETKALAEKLHQAIAGILKELNPDTGRALLKEAKSAGKILSRKLAAIQKDEKKKAAKALAKTSGTPRIPKSKSK